MIENVTAIILAAGKGTRMRCNFPKVLHPIIDRPLIFYIIDTLLNIGIDDIILVLGYEAEQIEQTVKEYYVKQQGKIKFAIQEPQLGTGHALAVALERFPQTKKNLLVLNGDTPMIPDSELFALTKEKPVDGMSLLTGILPVSTRFGRIIRDKAGKNSIKAIREACDCTEEELLIAEMNLGLYFFPKDATILGLKELETDNSQGEYYLTDLVANFVNKNREVCGIIAEQGTSIIGINTQEELAKSTKLIQRKIMETHLENGVFIENPEQTIIGPEVRFHRNCRIFSNARITGDSIIGENCQVGPNVYLHSVSVDKDIIISDCRVRNKRVSKNLGQGIWLLLILFFILLNSPVVSFAAESNFFEKILKDNGNPKRQVTKIRARRRRRVERVLIRIKNYLEKNNLNRARRDILTALKISSDYHRTYYYSGLFHIKKNQFERALDMFKKAYVLNPFEDIYQEKIKFALFELAKEKQRKGEYNTSLEYLNQLMILDLHKDPGKAEVRGVLIRLHKEVAEKNITSDPKTAIFHYKEVIKLDEENVPAIEGISKILLKSNQKQLALNFVSLLQSRFPQNREIKDIYNNIYLGVEGGPPGIRTINVGPIYIEKEADILPAFQKATELFNLKQFVDSLKVVEKIIEFQPKEKKARELKAKIFIENGEFAQSRAIINQLLSEFPHDPVLMNTLSDLEYSSGNYKKSIDILTMLLERDAKNPRLRFKKAQVANKLHELDLSFEILDGLYKENPRNPEVLDELGEVYIRKNMVASATRLWDEAIRIDPKFPNAYFHFGLFYSGIKQNLARALEYFKKAYELKAFEPKYIYYLGDTLLKLTKNDEARKLFEQNVSFLNPGNVYTQQIKMKLRAIPSEISGEAMELIKNETDLMKVAKQYVVWNMLPEAKKVLEKILSEDPHHYDALINLGTVNVQAGDYLEAMVNYSRSLKLNPKPSDQYILENLAFCYLQFQLFENAVKFYESAVNLYPENWDSYLKLATIHQLLGNQQSAIDVLETMRGDPRVNPEKREEANALIMQLRNSSHEAKERGGHLLATMHYKVASRMADFPSLLEESMEHIESAIKLNPTEVDYYRLKAKIIFFSKDHTNRKLDKETRASILPVIKSIFRLKPNDAFGYYLKGRYHLDMKHWLSAKNNLAFALNYVGNQFELGKEVLKHFFSIRKILKTKEDLENFDKALIELKKDLKKKGKGAFLSYLNSLSIESLQDNKVQNSRGM
ncbi:tetratricopeptide repeat protein [Candidatus Riflebacteria bacterium]